MNLLLLYDEDAIGSERFRVGGTRAAHLIEVLGVVPGQVIHVGRLEGGLGRAEVVEVGPTAVTVRVGPLRTPPPRTGLRLLLAVPRPKVLRRLLPQLAALGLDELVLFRCWRVERTHLHTDVLEPEVYRPLLHEGLMQGCSTREPRVRIERRFLPFVEDSLPAGAGEELRAIAHPRAEATLADGRIPEGGGRALVVGPERGFLDREVELFAKAGFQPVRLGGGILKVETACIFGLGQLELVRARGDILRPEAPESSGGS